MIKQEVRRIVLSPFFYFSIIALLICYFFTIVEDIPNIPDPIFLFELSNYGYDRMLIPILAVLASADSYLIERKSGYYYSVMSRTKRIYYCLSKAGVAITTGMIIILLSKLIFLAGIFLIVKLCHGEMVLGDRLYASFCSVDGPDPGAPHWIVQQNYLLFVGQIIFYECLYASIFPAIAFVVSVFCPNKYVVLLAPYVYANIMDVIFIGLKWYYVSPMVLNFRGRASLLAHEGLPFRIVVTLMYWGLEILIFLYGVNWEMSDKHAGHSQEVKAK